MCGHRMFWFGGLLIYGRIAPDEKKSCRLPVESSPSSRAHRTSRFNHSATTFARNGENHENRPIYTRTERYVYTDGQEIKRIRQRHQERTRPDNLSHTIWHLERATSFARTAKTRLRSAVGRDYLRRARTRFSYLSMVRRCITIEILIRFDSNNSQ